MATKKKPEFKVELWPISAITPYELNAKIHDPAQIAKIAASITRFGWDVPIVVDQHGMIIKGHGRRLAAIELGMDQVPVVIRDDLTPDQVKAARLADNRVAVSDIDTNKLKADLLEIDYDMSGIFDDKELDFLDADLGVMNEGAFIDDMDQTVADQKKDLDGRMETAAGAAVPVHKAFGFKTVPGGGQLAITRFMALAEAETGMQGGDALVVYAKRLADAAA